MKDEKAPELQKESSIQAPFGKRVLDMAVSSRFSKVARLKFWPVMVSAGIFVGLLTMLEADRIERLTPRAIPVDVKAVTSQGGRILIPALVNEYRRPVELEAWMKAKVNPIKILSFFGDQRIPPGTEGHAVLLTGATNGLIKARIVQNVVVDGVTVLEAGVVLLGQGHSTEERLFVDFKKAVFRDGKFLAISAQAYDASDAILGLKGSRVGDATIKLAASAGLNFLSGMATGLESQAYDEFGRPQRPSAKDAALNGASKAASEQARQYMEDVKGRRPIIEVKAGTVFQVTFDGGE